MYLTYEDYKMLGGTLDVGPFNNFEFQAESIIDWYTFDRLKNETEYPPELQRCMFMLLSVIAQKNAAMSVNSESDLTAENAIARITEQSNDGVSVKYATLSPFNLVNFCDQEIDSIVKTCLRSAVNKMGRHLLYRGYYPGE